MVGSLFLLKSLSAQILMEQGKFSEAAEIIQMIETTIPEYKVDFTFARTKASCLCFQNKTEESTELFKELLKNPDADIYFDYGSCLMFREKWKEALVYLEKSASCKFKDTSAIFYKIAVCKAKLGRLKEASEDIKKVAYNSPDVEEFKKFLASAARREQ